LAVTPVQLNPDGEYISLIPVSCLHVGSADFNKRRALAMRQKILDTPDCYTWDLGDQTENGLRDSPGTSVFRQVLSPSEQDEWLEDYYKPLADRGKLLGLHNSNHSYRTEKAADQSPVRHTAKYLGVPYLGWQSVLSIKVGENHKRRYNLFSTHGNCNARTEGAVVNYLLKLRELVDLCDCYICSHVHRRIGPVERVISLPGKTKIKEHRAYFMSIGGFLNYGGYAEMLNLPRPVNGTVEIRLYQTEPHVEIHPVDI